LIDVVCLSTSSYDDETLFNVTEYHETIKLLVCVSMNDLAQLLSDTGCGDGDSRVIEVRKSTHRVEHNRCKYGASLSIIRFVD
jgi:hypothetical protein